MEGKSRSRGFASMASQKQREIARKGGRAAHEKGRAHEFTSDEARKAGRKGGEKVSVNRLHMAEIGRRGGRSSANRRRTTASNPGDKAAVNQEMELERSMGSSDEEEERGELGMAIPPDERRESQNPSAGI